MKRCRFAQQINPVALMVAAGFIFVACTSATANEAQFATEQNSATPTLEPELPFELVLPGSGMLEPDQRTCIVDQGDLTYSSEDLTAQADSVETALDCAPEKGGEFVLAEFMFTDDSLIRETVFAEQVDCVFAELSVDDENQNRQILGLLHLDESPAPTATVEPTAAMLGACLNYGDWLAEKLFSPLDRDGLDPQCMAETFDQETTDRLWRQQLETDSVLDHEAEPVRSIFGCFRFGDRLQEDTGQSLNPDETACVNGIFGNEEPDERADLIENWLEPDSVFWQAVAGCVSEETRSILGI